LWHGGGGFEKKGYAKGFGGKRKWAEKREKKGNQIGGIRERYLHQKNTKGKEKTTGDPAVERKSRKVCKGG